MPLIFPLKERLLLPTRRFIDLLEWQLSILYPSGTLIQSEDVKRFPFLKQIVGFIIGVSEQFEDCGYYCKRLLVDWLQFEYSQLPSNEQLISMLENKCFLERLYQRGIIDHEPATFSFHTLQTPVEIMPVNSRITDVSLVGEHKKFYLLSTPPICQAWNTSHFLVDTRGKCSTTNLVRLMIDGTNVNFPDIKHLSFDRYCSEQSIGSPKRMDIIVVNARGGFNPRFINRFRALANDTEPPLAVVTETRVSGQGSVDARKMLGYDSSVAVESIGHLGGIWILWKCNVLNVELVTRHQNSITIKLDFDTMYA